LNPSRWVLSPRNYETPLILKIEKKQKGSNRAGGSDFMEPSRISISDHRTAFPEPHVKNEAYTSGVSWAAVIAGAFVTAALSLILFALGTGMGLSSVSPWTNAGASASAISKGAIVWLILVQLIASAMGGYLAGRLRTKW
jgi:hypothetical protein